MSVALILSGTARVFAADSPDDVGAADAATVVDSVTVPSWTVEVTGGLFVESWDMNQFREHLAGGAVSVFRRLSPRWTIGVEAHMLHVDQDPVENGLLPALVAMLRWNAFQIGATSVFVEGGAGPAYATTRVPAGGTQMNIVTQTGAGLARALTARVDMLGGARWIHVSNNSLDGHHRNPDIQAIGFYVGWRFH